jgi:hypothetical protein
MGTVHGGVCCAIADTAMGIAHASMLEDGETSTSLEIKINFVRPVWKDTLTARPRGQAWTHGEPDGMRCTRCSETSGRAGQRNVHDATGRAGRRPLRKFSRTTVLRLALVCFTDWLA